MVKLVRPPYPPISSNLLPVNYNFELAKTVFLIQKHGYRHITLQFPDGLLKFAPGIIDIIESNTGAYCTLLADVVYGACCIDDKTSKLLNSDFIVHYGHSCLVPVTFLKTKCLYVFVDISFDITHCIEMLKDLKGRVCVLSTIQYARCLKSTVDCLNGPGCSIPNDKNPVENESKFFIPQAKPLSTGEVLGCTSPLIKQADTVVFIGDGRFHLESVMIQNPKLKFYKYCVFSKVLSRETYDHSLMTSLRNSQVKQFWGSSKIGIILGDLGRQGNKDILKRLVKRLENFDVVIFRLKEITPIVLEMYATIDSFVQISCPRLSIDWGNSFSKPLLNPFEVYWSKGDYCMDYYQNKINTPWSNYYK